MSAKWIKLSGAFVVYCLALFVISYLTQQHDFILNFTAYSVAFTAFLSIVLLRNQFTLSTLKKLALLLFLVPFFSSPSLSPDVYRFLWDGEITTMGIHPYAAIPEHLMETDKLIYNSSYMNLLYENITDLSKQNYSIYPTVNQIYFLIPAVLSDDLFTSLFILRILILLTLMVGGTYFFKLMDLLSIPQNNAVLLMLNPIVIVEVMGNFHFEGVMLSWLIVGIYFLLKKQWLKSSVFWAVAINIKLTPLLLLPFLLRFCGFKNSLKLYSLTLLFSLSFLFIYLWPAVFSNFMQSIQLYFDNFEFNAGIFYLIKWISSFFINGNPTLIIGPALSILALISIIWLALSSPLKKPKELLNRMMWGYLVYLLLATTVHPWYVILPLGFAVFSNNLAVVFWSYLIFLSYGFYAFGNTTIGYGLIAIEYLILILLLIFPQHKWGKKWKTALKLDSPQ